MNRSEGLLLFRKVVMDKESVRQELELLFQERFVAQGFELVDVIYRKEGAHLFLRILADRVGGGINLDECAQLSRDISQALDELDIIPSRYMLEVSSPGLNRCLATQKDFMRSLNKKAVFYLSELINGKCQWHGEISKVDGESVFIDSGGSILEIPLTKINKATLTI
ncbi:MAG: ribosome maturation factor RimP [Candidatus Omnitrophica bacterium]|nr:ribosome maturation factor RimP [Candidatus Omnitrophota bacterium]